jgi:F-type H+-transporting ATPase subunit a
MNLTGMYYHGTNLLSLFFPAGTPIMIVPLLIMIEIISYFARMFSLAIRLFANITAGHILLKILSWFVYLLIDIFFLSIWGFLLITLLWGLEFFISLLQAYVFLILLCIYVIDVLNLH